MKAAKTNIISIRKIISISLMSIMILTVNLSFAKKVTEKEAIAIAKIWYAMELNSGYLKIDDAERTERINNISFIQIKYLTADSIWNTYPENLDIIGYVISFNPNGYVLVPAEDCFSPVIAFNATSEFFYNDSVFMKTFIERRITVNWDKKIEKRNTLWDSILSKSIIPFEKVTFSDIQKEIESFVQFETANWDQGTFYNETVINHNGNINGIPTGCTATAMAIKMRYHEWPSQGTGTHSYSDDEGNIQFDHSVNLGNTNYNWTAMPITSLTSINTYVENLMYQCGVTVDINYEVGGSYAWPTVSSMNSHFRYRGTKEFKYNDSFGNEIKNSIIGGLPTICSSSGHTIVVDGYRSTVSPFYHVNCGWSGSGNDWYNLESDFPGSDASIDRSYSYSSPNNWVYVDKLYSGNEAGTLEFPYNTIQEGYSNTPSDGQLWFKTGTYNGSGYIGTFDKAMTLHSYNGSTILE